MSSIRKRARRTPSGKPSYQVRYRDLSGNQRSKSFRTNAQARAFQIEVDNDLMRGTYVDRSLGLVSLSEYAEYWLSIQGFRESTREQTTIRLRKHILPSLGDTSLAAIRPSQVQAWVRSRQNEGLAPRTIKGLVSLLTAILNAAVDDDRIAKNPCHARSLKLPEPISDLVDPWPRSQVHQLLNELPDRYRVLLVLAAGLGLRQGEVFGLALDDVDFLSRSVTIQRQVKIVGSRLVFDRPKRGKARTVPLPESVALQLSAHIAQFPPRPVTLPWERGVGKPTQAQLLVTSREGGALNRNYINRSVWRPALVRAGIAPVRGNMMHGARHFYASAQLEGGTTVRALSDYLGHADVGFTLRTYTHLMPEAEGKAKRAVDAVFDVVETDAISPLSGPNVAPGPR